MLNRALYSSTGLSVGTNELSLSNGTTSIAVLTTVAEIVIVLDLVNMVAGDEFELAVWEAAVVGGTQRRTIIANFLNAQSGLFYSPRLFLGAGWDATLVSRNGTTRTVPYAIRSTLDTASVAGATVGTATNVTTLNGIAAAVITAASIATDAITAAKIAASAITSSEAPALANLDVASSTLATATNLAVVAGYIDTEIQTLLTNLATANAALVTHTSSLAIIQGLAGRANTYLDNTTYDANGFMTAGRLRIFSTAGAANAATDGGSGEGEIATLTLAGVAAGASSPLNVVPDTVRSILS